MALILSRTSKHSRSRVVDTFYLFNQVIKDPTANRDRYQNYLLQRQISATTSAGAHSVLHYVLQGSKRHSARPKPRTGTCSARYVCRPSQCKSSEPPSHPCSPVTPLLFVDTVSRRPSLRAELYTQHLPVGHKLAKLYVWGFRRPRSHSLSEDLGTMASLARELGLFLPLHCPSSGIHPYKTWVSTVRGVGEFQHTKDSTNGHLGRFKEWCVPPGIKSLGNPTWKPESRLGSPSPLLGAIVSLGGNTDTR